MIEMRWVEGDRWSREGIDAETGKKDEWSAFILYYVLKAGPAVDPVWAIAAHTFRPADPSCICHHHSKQ
jgi:hypothetical protein